MTAHEWIKSIVDNSPLLALALLNWMLTKRCDRLFEDLKVSENNVNNACNGELVVTYGQGKRAKETWLIGPVLRLSSPDSNEQC